MSSGSGCRCLQRSAGILRCCVYSGRPLRPLEILLFRFLVALISAALSSRPLRHCLTARNLFDACIFGLRTNSSRDCRDLRQHFHGVRLAHRDAVLECLRDLRTSPALEQLHLRAVLGRDCCHIRPAIVSGLLSALQHSAPQVELRDRAQAQPRPFARRWRRLSARRTSPWPHRGLLELRCRPAPA